MSDPAWPTRARIMHAAIRLFAERGFAATGIRDLASGAGINSSALYHYVGTKEELLVEIMQTGMTLLKAAADRALDGVDGPAERLATLVHVHVAAEARFQLGAQVVDNEMRSLSDDARVDVLKLRDVYEHLWDDAIADGVTSGVFRAGDLRVARLAVLEMCNGVSRWYRDSGPLGLTELMTHFSDHALAMLRAHRGRRPLGSADLRIPGPDAVVAIVDELLATMDPANGS